MKATDARRHSPKKLEVLRERGFALRREGYRVVEIAQVLGVVRGTVYKWFRHAVVTDEQSATLGGRRGRPKRLESNSALNKKLKSDLFSLRKTLSN